MTTLLLLTLLPALPALAQDAAAPAAEEAGENRALNFFQAFFLPAGSDPLGYAIIWVLILLAIFTTGYSIQLTLRYKKGSVLPTDNRDKLIEMIDAQQYREAIDTAESDPSFLGRVTSAALNEAPNGYGAMERAVEEAGDAEATRMLRPIEYLNVVGNIAPMMGLFGTVYGMILAFQKLVSAGGSPDPVQLAGGISTALVTTFWGLVVAIPALAFYSLIRNRVDALTTEGILEAETIIAAFKPGAKKGSGKSSRATPKVD